MTTSLPAFARGVGPADDEKREQARQIQLRFRFSETGGEGLEQIGNLVPLHLYPWLEFGSIRSDYPAVVWQDGGRAESLTSVVDRIIDESNLDGDEKEYFRRSLFLVEAEIRRTVDAQGKMDLEAAWKSSIGTLSEKLDKSERDRVLADATSAREYIETPGEAVPFGREAVEAFISSSSAAHAERLTAAFTGDIAILKDKLNAILELDRSEAAEARSPNSLADSIGEAFSDDFDFDQFSKLLEKSPHGPTISPERRERVTATIAELDSFLSTAAEPESGRQDLVKISASGGLVEYASEHRVRSHELVRAVQTARLEAENLFDEETHGRDLAALKPELLDRSDVLGLPIRPAIINQKDFPKVESELRHLLDRGEPVKVFLLVESPVSSANLPAFETPPTQRALAAGGAQEALFQVSLTQLDDTNEAIREALAFDGPAFVSIYIGAEFGPDRLHPYLCAAAPHDARVFPAFRNNPAKGQAWADRFDVEWNPSMEKPWADSDVKFLDVDGEEREAVLPFTAADLMAMDERYRDGFRRISLESWHDGLVPFDEFLPGDRPRGLVPYILMVDPEDGSIYRVICSDRIVDHGSVIAARWRSLQELGGIESSHAVRAIEEMRDQIEQESKAEIDRIKKEFETDLNSKTGVLAERIVSNIAASLLGADLGSVRTVDADSATLQTLETSTDGVGEQPPDAGSETSRAEELPPEEEPEAEEDDAEVLSFDDPYIETPRCTTCDECTTINPRMFSYNENKQAYIADPSAGTFRELVMAAEKCPVKIIHPGKPRDPEEPRLDELLERAEAFN